MTDKARKLEPLVLEHVPLHGTNLIEASAGTGKTWTIAALYVRLLLEERIPVEQLLVVTYTKAATAELKTRVLDRLLGLREALNGSREALLAS
ncbi:MAG TPA: UvrD-helicase domain-containing protein, partial [Steroidobacteraceae bacterium]|nr:UvrD-helicase domain-containing protein [Steroidobacteraceae bacterium]